MNLREIMWEVGGIVLVVIIIAAAVAFVNANWGSTLSTEFNKILSF